MKSSTFGVVLLLVAAAAALVWLGRLTVPDRTAELEAWRDSAQAVLGASRIREAERAAVDSARIAEAEARAEAEIRRTQATQARAAAGLRVVDSLRVEVAQAEALRDTARIVMAQAAVIVAQDTVIQGLQVGLMDAQSTLIELRGDLQAVREARAQDLGEIGRLRETIAAGLAATKPSRGRALGFLDCTIGVGATSQGLDYRSATCGVSVRGLIGGR